MRDLTKQEQEVLDLLGKAAMKFFDLPPAHPADSREFTHHMHACQNILLSRPATEAQRELAVERERE